MLVASGKIHPHLGGTVVAASRSLHPTAIISATPDEERSAL
jgi:hypothetical protein